MVVGGGDAHGEAGLALQNEIQNSAFAIDAVMVNVKVLIAVRNNAQREMDGMEALAAAGLTADRRDAGLWEYAAN